MASLEMQPINQRSTFRESLGNKGSESYLGVILNIYGDNYVQLFERYSKTKVSKTVTKLQLVADL